VVVSPWPGGGVTARGARWRRGFDTWAPAWKAKTDRWDPWQNISELKTLPNENSLEFRKISGEFVGEEGLIVNNFCYYYFLRLSTDFELV
jgi:hypothetical protein